MRPLLPLLLLLSQPLTQSSAQTGRQGSAPEPFEVELVGSISAPRLTIRSEGASAESVMRAVAHVLGRDLEGFDVIHRNPLITARLVDRPAKDAVRWTLGSVGLRAIVDPQVIRVVEDVSAFPDRRELLMRANVRYLRALSDHPGYPAADRAQMDRAEINELLGPGSFADAVYNYETLIEDHPTSPLVSQALLRCARLLALQSEWSSAVARYEQLAGLEFLHPYHAVARLELARSLCRLGEASGSETQRRDDAEKALLVLDALDDNYETRDRTELRRRLLARALALALAARPSEAVKSLDLAATYSEAGLADAEVLELRALAMEHADRHGDAATAWMMYGERVGGDRRVVAYERAADAALRGGFELATLAIHARAEAEGFGQALAEQASEARSRLRLDQSDLSAMNAAQQIARAEEFVRRGKDDLAVQALRPLYLRRDALGRSDSLRLALAYARALDGDGMLDDAIGVLRRMVAGMDKLDDRRRVYLLASQLFERHGHWENAIDALQGRL